MHTTGTTTQTMQFDSAPLVLAITVIRNKTGFNQHGNFVNARINVPLIYSNQLLIRQSMLPPGKNNSY